MTQADSVHSTPPANTSLTRRNMIGAMATVGAVAIATATPAIAGLAEPDPIFAVIDAHRKAHAASAAASAEIKRLCDLADQIVGRAIEIPSIIEPGTTVEASIWLDIEEAIPSAEFPDQYAYYLALLEQHREARFAITGDTDPIGEEEYAAEWDAVREFANMVPTTLAGLRAMILYAAECQEHDLDAFTDHDCPLIENLATAAKALIGGQS